MSVCRKIDYWEKCPSAEKLSIGIVHPQQKLTIGKDIPVVCRKINYKEKGN